jgi:hypothetical protein
VFQVLERLRTVYNNILELQKFLQRLQKYFTACVVIKEAAKTPETLRRFLRVCGTVLEVVMA